MVVLMTRGWQKGSTASTHLFLEKNRKKAGDVKRGEYCNEREGRGGGRERERERNRETDRQTDRRTDGQTDRRTDGRTD